NIILSRIIYMHILQNDASLDTVNSVSWHPSVLKLAKNTLFIPERLSIKAATQQSCYSLMLTPSVRLTSISSRLALRHQLTSFIQTLLLSTIILLPLNSEPHDLF